MKVLIITDSLSLPRDTSETWDNTYVKKLKLYFPEIEFIHFAYGKATTNLFAMQVKRYYKYIKPDLIIMQCGIVDCTPRVLKHYESKILIKLKLSFILTKKVKLFIRKYRNLRYVKEEQFRINVNKIKSLFNPSSFMSIGILPPPLEHENKVKGIQKIVKSYNSILDEITDLIETTDFPKNGLIDDYVHMNKIGHEYIFNKIKKEIEQYDN